MKVLIILALIVLTGCQHTDKIAYSQGFSGIELSEPFVKIMDGRDIYMPNQGTMTRAFEGIDYAKGETRDILCTYENGGLAQSAVAVMVLQVFPKNDLGNNLIPVVDEHGEILRTYSFDELSEFVVFEDDDVAIIDMLWALSDSDITKYCDALSRSPYGDVRDTLPISSECLKDGSLDFSWIIDVRQRLMEVDQLLVRK